MPKRSGFHYERRADARDYLVWCSWPWCPETAAAGRLRDAIELIEEHAGAEHPEDSVDLHASAAHRVGEPLTAAHIAEAFDVPLVLLGVDIAPDAFAQRYLAESSGGITVLHDVPPATLTTLARAPIADTRTRGIRSRLDTAACWLLPLVGVVALVAVLVATQQPSAAW